MGARLLERGRYGARPTDAGRRILPYAVTFSLRSEPSDPRSTAPRVCSRAACALAPSPAPPVAFLPKAIARFTHAHPNVEVVLLEEPSQSTQPLAEWLQAQMVDVALVQIPAAGMKTVTLMRDELCALLPIGSQFASRRQISLRDLAAEPFIMSPIRANRSSTPPTRTTGSPRASVLKCRIWGRWSAWSGRAWAIRIVPRIAFPAAPPSVVLVPVKPASSANSASPSATVNTPHPLCAPLLRHRRNSRKARAKTAPSRSAINPCHLRASLSGSLHSFLSRNSAAEVRFSKPTGDSLAIDLVTSVTLGDTPLELHTDAVGRYVEFNHTDRRLCSLEVGM